MPSRTEAMFTPERRGQRALGGQPLAGRVAAREHVGGEPVEDLVGQARTSESSIVRNTSSSP